MLGQTFYHETLRRCVVGFGTLFNDIHITRKDSSGNTITEPNWKIESFSLYAKENHQSDLQAKVELELDVPEASYVEDSERTKSFDSITYIKPKPV